MKNTALFLFLTGALSLFASDPEGFTDLTDLTSAAPVLSENFNNGAADWDLPECWSYEPREGVTGSGALKYVRTDPDENSP